MAIAGDTPVRSASPNEPTASILQRCCAVPDFLPYQFRPQHVVSGGQTGVDRAGLDAAMALGLSHGGWCPRGRLAEDGVVPSRYELTENDSRDYTVRTEQNVVDSDATLIVYEGRLKGGTLLTRRLAQRLNRPCRLVRIDKSWTVQDVWQWFDEVCPQTLNVAGPRESTSPGIYDRSLQALLRILERPSRDGSADA